MSERHALARISVVDELAATLRARILDGDLEAGEPLRELELSMEYSVSRHTLRAAFRALATEGLVRVKPNRGASVSALGPAELHALFELRTALELEAAHLALARNGGRLPPPVHQALAHLTATCRRARPSWRAVAVAHAGLHGAIVSASASPRLEAAYATLAGELALFLIQLRPTWSLERMVEHHERLISELESRGPEALRGHLADGLDAVTSGVPR
jgi:DNA-binding GntR family transcriptional regulator